MAQKAKDALQLLVWLLTEDGKAKVNSRRERAFAGAFFGVVAAGKSPAGGAAGGQVVGSP